MTVGFTGATGGHSDYHTEDMCESKASFLDPEGKLNLHQQQLGC